ncbi:MAG: hypothetical protein N2111_13575 [Candidatus Sumerlaeaceae bacterium]|nr:hypothetical protein [Candidatus Sumerlaeaceae bacterium]
MNDTHNIKCPCCNTILVVDRRTGKIVEERRPILDQSTGDRFEDAAKKVRERASLAEDKFRQMQKERQSRSAKLDALFKDSMQRVKESGDDSKPVNPFDMD